MAQLHQEQKQEDALAPVQAHKWDILKSYQIPDPWQPPQVTLNWTQHTAWGPTISRHMTNWMLQCRWPKEASDDAVASIGVSWYELVLSFMKYTGMFFPLRRHDNQGREILIPFRSRQEVDAYGVKFSEFANTFCNLLSAIHWTLVGGPLAHATKESWVKSMFVQGSFDIHKWLCTETCFPTPGLGIWGVATFSSWT